MRYRWNTKMESGLNIMTGCSSMFKLTKNNEKKKVKKKPYEFENTIELNEHAKWNSYFHFSLNGKNLYRIVLFWNLKLIQNQFVRMHSI